MVAEFSRQEGKTPKLNVLQWQLSMWISCLALVIRRNVDLKKAPGQRIPNQSPCRLS